MFTKYYFYHITYIRISNGDTTGVAMGTAYGNRFTTNPVKVYATVKKLAEEGCPEDSTWSIDTIQGIK